MTTKYELALNTVREATRKFEAARIAYRNGSIGDKEFLEASVVYTDAEKLFDAAFAKEQRKGK